MLVYSLWFMRILLVAFVVSITLSAQSVDDLRQKYGNPVSQTFALRQGIGLRVKSKTNGVITEMRIVPNSTDGLIESRDMTLAYELAKDLLAELLPPSRRGKFVIGTFVHALCMPENDCAGVSEDYENVHIFYNSSAKPGQLCYVDIRLKRR